MTRRERMIRIIKDLPHAEAARRNMLQKLGAAAFTDEALEEWARISASNFKRMQRFNRENRAQRAAP